MSSPAVPNNKESPQGWWLYLLLCKDGRTYAGIAVDVNARYLAHSRGMGAKFTRANPPLSVLGAQPFASRSAASKAEHALKQLAKSQKLQWAQRWPPAVPPSTHTAQRR